MSEPTTFADFGVQQPVCDALTDAGITTPFPIQELTLPLALQGADIIGQARTGTGKTLAFGIPLLQRIDAGQPHTQALVIVPTRELCVQVTNDLRQAASKLDVRVVPVYGGKSIDSQVKAVGEGAPVVVGTPGRLLDLKARRVLDLSRVTTLVLDEADEMLDLGFLPDVERLIEATASARQTLLFSATMPNAVVALARRYMQKPTFLRAEIEEARIAPETRQHFFSCHRLDKPAVLARILESPNRGLCVVFTRTKRMADVLAEELRDRGLDAAPIHSDLRQEARERTLSRFRNGRVDVLVATEVAARGLDIDDVTHVVNYDCPDDEKMYLHRIGRTGRAGAAGVAITLAVWNELARLDMIKKALDVEEPTHEVFSTSQILDELFDLPPRPPRPRPAPAAAEQAPAQKASRSRRRRTSRGTKSDGGDIRKASAAPKPARTGTKDDSPPKEKTPSPAPTAETADAEPKQRPARRRTRRRRGGQAAEPTAEKAAAPTTEPSASEDREADDIRRTRTRTRSRTGAVAGEQDERRRDHQKPGRPSRRSDPTPEKPTTSGRGRGSRRRAGAGRDDGSRPAPSKRPAAKRSNQEDTAALRGDAKPMIRRPLVIQHLP